MITDYAQSDTSPRSCCRAGMLTCYAHLSRQHDVAQFTENLQFVPVFEDDGAIILKISVQGQFGSKRGSLFLTLRLAESSYALITVQNNPSLWQTGPRCSPSVNPLCEGSCFSPSPLRKAFF